MTALLNEVLELGREAVTQHIEHGGDDELVAVEAVHFGVDEVDVDAALTEVAIVLVEGILVVDTAVARSAGVV